MSSTIIVTNQQQLSAIAIDDENRTLSFEYGGELLEFVYHIPGDAISIPILLGNLQEAASNTGSVVPLLQGYITDGTLLADESNPFEISAPMWLAVK